MDGRMSLALRFGLLLAGLCWLVAPLATAQAQPLRADCLSTLHAELGTVLPGGLSCSALGNCATSEAVAARPNTYIDVGTGIMSTPATTNAAQTG